MSLSGPAIQSANAAETGEAWISLLEIVHPSLSSPIRVTNNGENVTSNGNLFVALAFDVQLPDESDQVPRVTLRIDNVDRLIVDNIRALTSPPTFSLSVVLASSPDTIEAGPFVMTLSDADYDALFVSGTLVFEDVLNEPFPGDSYTPADFPGMF